MKKLVLLICLCVFISSMLSFSVSAVENVARKDTYSADELCELAKKYYEMHWGFTPPYVEVDHMENDMFVIHLYESTLGHTATWDWYTVGYNGKGESMFSGHIDLSDAASEPMRIFESYDGYDGYESVILKIHDNTENLAISSPDYCQIYNGGGGFADLNGDGIKEFLVLYQPDTQSIAYSIYTKDNEIVKAVVEAETILSFASNPRCSIGAAVLDGEIFFVVYEENGGWVFDEDANIGKSNYFINWRLYSFDGSVLIERIYIDGSYSIMDDDTIKIDASFTQNGNSINLGEYEEWENSLSYITNVSYNSDSDGENFSELLEIIETLENNRINSDLFRQGACEYSNDLASFAAELSGDAEDKTGDGIYNKYISLGIAKNNIHLSPNYNGDRAFSIASTRVGEIENYKDLLIITCRGSKTGTEYFEDAFAKSNKAFNGYITWDLVDDFYNDVINELKDFVRDRSFLKNSDNLIILINGHSLGGAAANIVGASLNLAVADNSEDWPNTLKKDDIYVYTYGALNSIKITYPVYDGYENIHNIYNRFDSFGPYRLGDYLPSGLGTMYGKFGHLDIFDADNENGGLTSFWIGDVINYLKNCSNHQISNYINAIKDNRIICKKSNALINAIRVVIACPVDIEIYENDTLIGSVIDEQIDIIDNSFLLYASEKEKCFFLEGESDWNIVISATDSGTMNISYKDIFDYDADEVCYTDIALRDGKIMSLLISYDGNTVSEEMNILDEQGNNAAIIEYDGSETEIPIETNGRSIYLILIFFVIVVVMVIVCKNILKRSNK